ncbi:MAG: DEAD/DEAH box helicase [Pirellulales bacterium]
MSIDQFHPIIAGWFHQRFGQPTDAQAAAWPKIASHEHTLVAAPTGSGKTLAAFLASIDSLFRQAAAGTLPDETQVVYVSPLKALSNDIHRNLTVPLAEIGEAASARLGSPQAAAGCTPQPIRVGLRTGDTPSRDRQAMLRRPPHILVTTPESLYLLLTGSKSREILRNVRTVIVDEIHALARDKRGSHLTLSLARLDQLCNSPPVRIGLSATQRPIDEIARYLVGTPNIDAEGNARCHIIDTGHVRQLDLAIEVPPSELSAVCSVETWNEIYARLSQLILEHRSTLVFVNTRRMAERVAHFLEERLGEGHVTSHHGSLARETRLQAEEQLKSGQLKAIVATASLELGIDIGYIDLVCQIGSPRSIATFLQRVGRAGHALGRVPKGCLFALTRDELLESLALVRAVRQGKLDRVIMPVGPLDILAQQIVAAVACEEWGEDELFELCRQAWPYRDLPRAEFDAIVAILSEGIAAGNRTGAYLHRDQIHHRLRPRRSARIAAITSGGAIPEQADYRVVTLDEGTFVGTLNEDFAIESQTGDVFQLGNTSWRIVYTRGGEVNVVDAHGAAATVPFWLGEAPGRTQELSAEFSEFREQLWERASDRVSGLNTPQALNTEAQGRRDSGAPWVTDEPPNGYAAGVTQAPIVCNPCGVNEEMRLENPGCAADAATLGYGVEPLRGTVQAVAWVKAHCSANDWAAQQAVNYVAAEGAAIGLVPSQRRVVFERFFDESGGMQLVIHAPFGSQINKAWGLALRKCFCRSFDFELQASADDNGIVLSVGPNHSFPLERMFTLLGTAEAKDVLIQALLAVPMFLIRWRWNVTRALAVLRQRGGKRVPPPLQRFKADDLLTAVFPMQTACFEHRTGDLEPPDHPLVRQTIHDCLHEAMDLDGWLAVLAEIEAGRIELVARDTREPSPFSHQLLNANPYAFLDDAPLEERRARAVTLRRTIRVDDVRDLGRLDADAIAQVRSEAWPLVRDAEELHDTLLTVGAMGEAEGGDWADYFEILVEQRRATRCRRDAGATLWIAAERWPVFSAAIPHAAAEPPVSLPEALLRDVSHQDGRLLLVRGRVEISGPTTANRIAQQLGLEAKGVETALEQLEIEGVVLRGQFTDEAAGEIEWCERRLLARIHRLTLDGLRRRVQPVDAAVFFRFLLAHHGLHGDHQGNGHTGRGDLPGVISRLQGFESPAGAWEHELLPSRLGVYEPEWLDEQFAAGELVWGRLKPPRQSDERRGRPLTRAMPISVTRRVDLAWLLPPEREMALDGIRWDAQAAYEALTTHGALFFDDLLSATSLLPSQLADALSELAALGLATSDGFSAIRALVSKHQHGRRIGRQSSKHRRRKAYSLGGRWSRFPPFVRPPTEDERTEKWAWLLLDRYGVMFRDLLSRESLAPPWRRLASIYRRLEMRGEIRGGRFVAGVAGEQFALPGAVDQLRQLRDQPAQQTWQLVSAADPLNLIGIITPGARVPATRSNRIVFCDGRPIASRESRQIRWLADVDEAARQQATRLLAGPDALRRAEIAATQLAAAVGPKRVSSNGADWRAGNGFTLDAVSK